MPRYDRDIIAALAEGRLDPEEAAAVEREITTNPIAAAELAAHRVALEAMSQAPQPTLSLSERSDLHAAVADALGIMDSQPEAAQRTRRVPWGSLGIAFAALVGLVAIAPIAGLLSTDGGDTTAALDLAPEAAASAPVPESDEQRSAPALAIEEAEPMIASEADVDDALRSGEDGAAGAAFGSSTTLQRTTTTVVAAAPTTAQAAATESTTTSSAGAEDYGAEVEQLALELEVIRSDAAAVDQLAADAIEETSCWAEDNQIRSDPPPQRFFFEYDNGQLTVVVYFELNEGEVGPFQVWGVPDCADLVVIP